MTYKPIKTEDGWGVMLKGKRPYKMMNGKIFVTTDIEHAELLANRWKGRVVRLRVTYEVGE